MKGRKSLYPLWALIPALVIYTVFSVIPILISFVFSFTNWNIERLYEPVFIGLANYVELLKDPVFIRCGMEQDEVHVPAAAVCGYYPEP